MATILAGHASFSKDDIDRVPESLREAICIFYVGATIKYLQRRNTDLAANLVYSFLCHISQKKADHDYTYNAIAAIFQYMREGLSDAGAPAVQASVKKALRRAYDDLAMTFSETDLVTPTFDAVLDELRQFIVGTALQIINSDKEQDQPQYSRRYNILIGGTKLARGVTIRNLIVTYYGRQAKRTNMDTMLQHARMYGYRQDNLDVTRLFVTPEVEERFRLINESEQALWEIIKQHPNEEYRGFNIGKKLNATRKNVLNPYNVGAYAAGTSYFPRKPVSSRPDVEKGTARLDVILDSMYPANEVNAVETTIGEIVQLVGLTKSLAHGGGLWDDTRIVAALETLRRIPRYGNRGYIIVRRGRGLRPQSGTGGLRSYFGGGRAGQQGEASLADPRHPTLFMFRLTGEGWDDVPFWVPNVRFPDGQYALMFNFE